MKFKRLIKKTVRKIIDLLILFLPIQRNKIVIVSYYGAGYGENSRYIVEEILRRKDKYKIIWLYSPKKTKKEFFPNAVTPIRYKSVLAYLHLGTAKIWIDNARKGFCPPKRKKQFYIQLWHGVLALKKIEADANTLSAGYINNAKDDSKRIDLFVSNSKTMTRLITNSFWYSGEVLECGYPRTDALFADFDLSNIHTKYGINPLAKIILYAPTFRSDGSLQYYNVDFPDLINKIEKITGEEWIVLIRLHPNISNKSSKLVYSKSVIDVSAHDDISELVKISDLLITDYSSVMFDFAILRKKVVLYTPDINEYVDDRGFYYNLRDLPFPVVEEKTRISDSIINFNIDNYLIRVDKFINEEGLIINNNSAAIIVDRIELERKRNKF